VKTPLPPLRATAQPGAVKAVGQNRRERFVRFAAGANVADKRPRRARLEQVAQLA